MSKPYGRNKTVAFIRESLEKSRHKLSRPAKKMLQELAAQENGEEKVKCALDGAIEIVSGLDTKVIKTKHIDIAVKMCRHHKEMQRKINMKN